MNNGNRPLLSVDTSSPHLRLDRVKRLQDGISSEEDPSLEEVGKRFRHLISGEDMDWHAKNLVQLLECSLFGFTIEKPL